MPANCADGFDRRLHLQHRWISRDLSTDIDLETTAARVSGIFGIHFLTEFRLALNMLIHDRHVVTAGVGRRPGQHLVENHAQAVDVGSFVTRLPSICSGAMYFGEPMT